MGCGMECGTLCDVKRGSVGCGMECGTLCDVERGRVWAVTRREIRVSGGGVICEMF